MSRLHDSEWMVLHGDSDESAIWAVLNDDGSAFDLTGWFIRAQARDSTEDPSPQFQWLVGDGIDVGVGTVKSRFGRRVKTSTVQLYLTPDSYTSLPRSYSGVVDVEIASDNSTAPQERHTLVRFAFRVEPDVSRTGV